MLGLLFLGAAIIFLVIFVEGTTELLVKSKIFSVLRENITRIPKVGSFLGGLITCGFCASVWVAIFPAILLSLPTNPINIFLGSKFISFIVWLVVIFRCSNYLHNYSDKYLDKFYSRKHYSSNSRSKE